MSAPQSSGVRRRRQREEAECEILDAAEELLRRLPPEQVSISSIMAATTLSRKSFYVYFGDRQEMLVRLVARLRAEADAAIATFARPDQDLVIAGRGAIRAVAQLYADHGEILRALSESRARDREAAETWRSFVEPVRQTLIERVSEEVKAGRISGIDPPATVTALISMNVSRFLEELVGQPDPDIEALVDQLYLIWIRALYGQIPRQVQQQLDAMSAHARAPQ